MCLTGDGNPGFHSKQCIIKMHTTERIASQPLTWMDFLPRESGTDKLCWLGHAQGLVPFLIPCIASNNGATMPGNSYSLLPGGTLAAGVASTDIAGLLCDPAHLQPPSFGVHPVLRQWAG